MERERERETERGWDGVEVLSAISTRAISDRDVRTEHLIAGRRA